MPSFDEAEKFVSAITSERSEKLARLQERKSAMQEELVAVEREMERLHDELRVGNQLSDVLVKYRESLMTVAPNDFSGQVAENRPMMGKVNY